MSFTAIGLDVISSGGSLGGLMASLTFSYRDLYKGCSTSGASKRAKCWSALLKKGLFGCDRSAILFHQPSRRRTAAHDIWTLSTAKSLQLLENPSSDSPSRSVPQEAPTSL